MTNPTSSPLGEKREIKFRGWDESREKMFPFYLKDLEGVGYGDMDICIYVKDFTCGKGNIGLKEENIMQYTGLKDKNSKEIYEGDIVVVDDNGEQFNYDGEKCVVEWQQASWGLKYKDDLEYNPFYETESQFEVIGNIYENPELL